MSEPGHDPYAAGRIRDLEHERDKLAKERDQLQTKRRDLQRDLKEATEKIASLEGGSAKQLKELQTALDAATTERDALQTKITTTPNELAAKVADLESQIRTRDFRDITREAVGTQLAEGVTVDDLWHFGDFDPAKVEAFDAKQAGELIEKVKTAKPILFASQAPGANGVGSHEPANSKAVLPSLRTAADASRGARDTSPGRITYRASDLKDPAFGVNNKHIMSAIAKGEATCLPD